jgi:hypothetical protein
MAVSYGEELLASHSTSKLEENALLAVRDSSFNTFTANFRFWGRLLMQNCSLTG